MKWIIMLLVLLAAGWAQSLFPASFSLALARPPFLTAAIVFYAVLFPAPVMTAAAFAGGMLADANGLMPLGVSALYYCVAGAAIQVHRTIWAEGGAVTAAVLTALTAGVQPLLPALAGLLAWERTVLFPSGWLRHLAAVMLMGAVAGALVWRTAVRLHQMTGTLVKDNGL